MDVGNAKCGGIEAVCVFDHVFVPNERIFLNGEVEFAGPLVDRFASYHRNSYGGCKAGVGDVLIGAASLFAQFNGVEKAAHIKDKLVEMTHMNETLYSGGIASSCEGYQTAAGNYIVDPMLANCCKLNVTRYPYEMCHLAEEIAGGLMVTAPSGADFDNPETGPYLRKLLVGANGVSAEDKLRALRLLETMCIGTGAVGFRTESMHGAGSPAAQKLNISRYANFNGKKDMAKHLANIK
ncbi:4-hydroxyphenylacetate 3-hydroxylase family protein [Pseudoflavonifractor phocaeensis]|uniref:4-hydroxyphenylacetate 3-hydroxylase family protein n=1 Tax=Pseudoflavonifractor phocaeensis TaxID=1870988 RepID=UPI001FAE9F28|nr:4-hydroxyphenylacetate 3-hydroxylase family protein [Pseudoflavonifractor phocaeensis]